MVTLGRLVSRLALYFGQVLALTAAGIALVWFLVWIFPFMFERTKGLWELVMGEEIAHTVVVGLAALLFAYIVALAADAAWRNVYLAPILGSKTAQDVPLSTVQKLVLAIATIEAALIVILMPGAWGVLDTIGHWLPDAGSPGVIGLALVLAAAVGTTIFLGDLWVFSWRAKPGHDLGPRGAPPSGAGSTASPTT